MDILMQMFPQRLLLNAIFVRMSQTDWHPWRGGGAVKKPGFLGACQEYILDKKAPDTHFGQCLRGFRVLKKVAIMTCTISAFCDIMLP
jgi:hypothetical protein